MDRQHVRFVIDHYPKIKSVSFLPLGGIHDINGSRKRELKSREYDVVFPGGLYDFTLKERLEELKSLPYPNNVIVLNLIDYLMNNRITDVTIALEVVLKDLFGSDQLDTEDYSNAISLAAVAGSFMRNYNREEVLRTLVNSKLDFHIFGDDLENRLGRESHDCDRGFLFCHRRSFYDWCC